MKRLYVVAALALLFLAGCAHPPHSGTVVSRPYRAAYTSTYTTWTCISRDRKGRCLSNLPSWHQTYHQAVWQLCLRADAGEKSDPTGCIDVDTQTYHTYPPGSHYSG